MKTIKELKAGDICYFFTPLRDAGTITVSEVLESMKEPNHYKIRFQEGLTVHAYALSSALEYCGTSIFLEKDKAIENLQYYKRTIERHINKLSNESVNFNSQVCTDREQSERLLALGLKKETADMCHRTNGMGVYFITALNPLDNPNDIPAWSLHRLIEIVAQTQYPYYVISKELPIYDALCERIEWLIKEGYFPKEYLV